jgi:hypothetical protein
VEVILQLYARDGILIRQDFDCQKGLGSKTIFVWFAFVHGEVSHSNAVAFTCARCDGNMQIPREVSTGPKNKISRIGVLL